MDDQTDQKPEEKPRDDDSQKPKKSSGSESGATPRSIGSLLLILAVALFLSLYLFNSPGSRGSYVSYDFFWDQLKHGNVKAVRTHGETLTGEWNEIPKNPEEDGGELAAEFNTNLPPVQLRDSELVTTLLEQEIEFDNDKTTVPFGVQFLVWLIVPILFLGFFWFMMRRSADPFSGGMMGNFIRSPARRFQASDQATTFKDVAAMEQAKRELQEVVAFLKDPEKFGKLGAEIPKGVLLMGPPGTGKTLLARATAGEAGVPFYSINGSEFIQMFVGVGASRVRDLFKQAKDSAPCILFVDEIDAVGRVRGAGVGGGHDEREQTLNQILSEMDGFQQSEAVVVVAATNRPDVLDPALLRPGRFDRHIIIERPMREGRAAILKVHSRKVPLADDVVLDKVAAGTVGFSGAELRNLVNEAALNATREGRDRVCMEDFELARDRVMMGAEREEVLNEHERRMTAWHEAGHALLAWHMPELDSVHKVSIIPRGRALGVTQLLPAEDRYNIGEQRLHSQLAMMMGGRAAEKLVFQEYSAGAEDDIKRATHMARRMVAHWGMSDKIGPVAFRQAEEHPFLGRDIHEQREFSEETARIIDTEVQRFMNEASEQAATVLTKHHGKLDQLAEELLDHESLDGDDVRRILGNSAAAD